MSKGTKGLLMVAAASAGIYLYTAIRAVREEVRLEGLPGERDKDEQARAFGDPLASGHHPADTPE